MKQHLDDLKEIRQLMERSSKFLSLSGLSGIAVGIIALVAAGIVYVKNYYVVTAYTYFPEKALNGVVADRVRFLAMVAVITFVLAIITGLYFTRKKAAKRGQKVWNKQSKQLLLNMSIPLLVGGVLGMALLRNGVIWPLAGITLLFYGLSLITISHFTYRDVFYLGIFEIILGLTALFWAGYALLFWALGFGVLHIIYGTIMYFKYDK